MYAETLHMVSGVVVPGFRVDSESNNHLLVAIYEGLRPTRFDLNPRASFTTFIIVDVVRRYAIALCLFRCCKIFSVFIVFIINNRYTIMNVVCGYWTLSHPSVFRPIPGMYTCCLILLHRRLYRCSLLDLCYRVSKTQCI